MPTPISPLTQTCNHVSDDRSHILISPSRNATRIVSNDTNVLAKKDDRNVDSQMRPDPYNIGWEYFFGIQ